MVKLVWKKHREFSKKKVRGGFFPNAEIICPQLIKRFKEHTLLKKSYVMDYFKNTKIGWINKLFWGDNLKIISHLLNSLKEKIDLIYIDPPFFTNSAFFQKIFIGTQKNSFKKKAYDDKWHNGIDSYLSFMHNRLTLMKQLLSDKGSIYIHVDWHVSHYLKIMMDELFGKDQFQNEIIWYYPAASAHTSRYFVRSYDSILFYTKSPEDYIFNDDPNIYMNYSKRVEKNLQKDAKGTFYFRGGSHDGKKLSRKVYVKKRGVFPRDVWTKIPYIRANTLEYQGFSTQKPERLLKRIILASSREGSIIADFFCGTGTTLAVAEKLNRRWIGCDLNWHSINTTVKRLLDLAESNDILNWEEKYGKNSHCFELYDSTGEIKKGKIPEKVQEETSKNRLKSTISSEFKSNFKLKLNIKREGRKLQLSLIKYIYPYFEFLSEKMKKKVSHWVDLIDYFAVDFNYNHKTFIPDWISYRTPKKRTIEFSTGWYHTEDTQKKKSMDIKSKVVDIFGFETTKTLSFSL
jgi:adenine specific DNA methylase Mod